MLAQSLIGALRRDYEEVCMPSEGLAIEYEGQDDIETSHLQCIV